MTDKWLSSGLLLVVLLSPLPFGSVQPGFVLVLELSAALLAAGALWAVLREPSRLGGRVRYVIAAAVALIAIAVLQLLPLPEPLVRVLAPPTLALREAVGQVVESVNPRFAPLSLSPPETADALLRLVAYVFLGLVAVVALRDRVTIKRTAIVITLAGAFQGFYGAFEYLSGRHHIFGFAKKFYLDSATGTFINRNHYAAYLAMTLPVALSLFAFASRPGERRSNWRERFLALAEPSAQLRIFAGFSVFCIWCGVLLSYSRAGLAAAFISSALVVRSLYKRNWGAWLVVVTLVAATGILLFIDINPPAHRVSALPDDLTSSVGRVPVWLATLDIVRDYPLLGSGLGTFENLFPAYAPVGLPTHWDHAHNDWLQATAEGGILALAVLLWMVFLVLVPSRTPSRFRGRSQLIGMASGAGIAAVALHSLVDFSLRIPAVAVLLVVLVGLRLAAAETERVPGGLGPREEADPTRTL